MDAKILPESALHYQAILSAVSDPISYVDREYKYRMVNETYARYAGRPVQEIVGLTVAQLLSTEIFESTVKPRLDRCFSGHQVHYQDWFDVPKRGLRFMDVRYSPVFDPKGSVLGAAVSSRDITAHKETEQALRESRQFLQSALDALSANIAVIDEQGRIVAVNASWCRFGQENGLEWADCGVGQNYMSVLDNTTGPDLETAQNAARGIRAVISGTKPVFWQEYPCHSPTEQRWYAMWVTRFEGQEGVRAVVAHENVTERRLAETALREQAKETAVAKERNRLARELHDAVTQTIFSASVIAESIPRFWEQHPEQAKAGLEELRQLTRGALAEMRALLLELRPAALTEKPLGELLRSLAEATTSRTRIPIELEVQGDDRLPAVLQITFYRIAQEALNNVVKHAQASCAEVCLTCAPDRVELCIYDDGVGFDPQETSLGHLGLGIMNERAQGIGALLTITSHPQDGTEVSIVWCGPPKGDTHGYT